MRRARLRTTHGPAAATVAAAVEPDNTASMTTRVDGSVVETTVERDTTGGLHSSVDDYVVNLTVADRLVGSVVTVDDTEANRDAVTTDGDAQPDDHTDTTDNTDDTHE